MLKTTQNNSRRKKKHPTQLQLLAIPSRPKRHNNTKTVSTTNIQKTAAAIESFPSRTGNRTTQQLPNQTIINIICNSYWYVVRVCSTQHGKNSIHAEVCSFGRGRFVIVVLILPIKYSVSYW